MKWIEASERLPEKKGVYFCYDKRHGIKKALFYNTKKQNSLLLRMRNDFMWLDENFDISEKDIWNKACEEMLKSISKTFLAQSNIDKADLETDKHVIRAIGETIINFPKPDFIQK